jgi:VWFA-related protein
MRHLALLFAAPALFLQSGLPPLVERVNVSVINVDATVFDRSGKPVTSLTKDDFEILEDGKPQKITNFYVIEAAVPHVEGSTAAQQPAPVEKRFQRKAILVVDNNFIDKRRRDAALAEAQKFIDSGFQGGYQWSVATIGAGVHTIQALTDDKQKIAAAIEFIRHRGTVPRQQDVDRGMLSDETFNRDPGRDSINEFQRNVTAKSGLVALAESAKSVIDACRAYSSIDGKKIIVLVTGGMEIDNRSPMPNDAMNQPSWMLDQRENRRQAGKILEAMVHEANAANFNIYVVNASGPLNPHAEDVSAHGPDFAGGGPDGFSSPHSTQNPDSFPLSLSWQTGGDYMTSNDIGSSLRRVELATANYYSLGYSPEHFEDGKYHIIVVRVKRPGLTVRHRAGYADLSGEQRFEDALHVSAGPPVLPHQLSVEMQVGAVQKENDKLHVPITVVTPMKSITLLLQDDRNVGRVHIYLSVFDEAGTNVGFEHRRQNLALTPAELDRVSQINGNFRYFLNLGLKPGKYRVVVAVRDDITNEIGLAAQDLTL